MRSGIAALAALAAGAAANPNKFEAVSPGGDTKCIHGTPYSFMHRKGTVKKLVVEMEGGGGCWNAATCSVGTCTQSVNKDGEVKMLNKANSGMHDSNNPKNAFAEWYHVYIPYCTCDAHTGANDPKYFGKTYYHRGHINFMSAMNWTLANFPQDMEVVTISGCSAGSVGVLVNWPWVADMYPKAQHYTFGDSYIGLFAPGQYNDAYTNWKLQWDTRLPGYAPSKVEKYFTNMACYTQEVAGAAYPNAVQAWYTSDADVVQTAFYTLGGGAGFTKNMRDLVSCYQNNASYPHNKAIHTFIAKGDAHCRSQDDGYYTVTAEGHNLAEWVDGIVSGARDEPRDVDCADDTSCPGAPVVPPPKGAPKAVDLSNYADNIPYRQQVQAGVWTCSVCQHVYDAAKDGGGAAFEDLPDTWTCPVCGAAKSAYKQSADGRWAH